MQPTSYSNTPEVSDSELPHDKPAERLYIVGLIDMADAWNRLSVGLNLGHFLDAEARGIFDLMVKKSKNGRNWLRSDFPRLGDRAGVPLRSPPEYHMAELRKRIVDARFLREAFLQAQGVATASLRGDVDKVTALIEQNRSDGFLNTPETWEGQELVWDGRPAEFPPLMQYIKGLVVAPAIDEMWANYGGHKTNVTLSQWCAIAAGLPWCGFETTQAPVLYIGQDMNKRLLLKRRDAFMAGLGIDYPLPFDILCYPDPPLKLLNNSHLLRDAINRMADKYGQMPVTGLDHLASVSGVKNELGLEYAEAVDSLAVIANDLEIYFRYLHHTSRMNWSRGNTQRQAKIEYSIQLKTEGEFVTFNTSEKQRGGKSEYEGLVVKFNFELTDDGTEMSKAWFERSGEGEFVSERTRELDTKYRGQIARTLSDKPRIKRTALYTLIGGRTADVRYVLNQMLGDFSVRDTNGELEYTGPRESGESA